MQFRRIANRPTGNPFGTGIVGSLHEWNDRWRLSMIRQNGLGDAFKLPATPRTTRHCFSRIARIRRGVCRHKATPPRQEKGLIAVSKRFWAISECPRAWRKESKRRGRLTCSPVDWINSVDVVIAREYDIFCRFFQLVQRIVNIINILWFDELWFISITWSYILGKDHNHMVETS